MDLSLGTDTISSAYLHHHLQQQEQQQQLLHYQQQQQDQHQRRHYHHHQAQLPHALSLAPPSGTGSFDLQSLERKGASNSGLSSGHLAPPSFYDPESALSSCPSYEPPSSPVATHPTHHLIPSHSSGQLWSGNSVNVHSPQVGVAQSLHQTSAQVALATAHHLHSSAYSGGTRSCKCPATEPHRLQLSQHLGDNCLPPGVEPSVTGGMDSKFSHGHAQSYPLLTPHWSLDVQAYGQFQQLAPLGVVERTGTPPQKLLPKRNSAKDTEKQNSTGKTTVRKGIGAALNLTPEMGPGWCSVCQRNCVTAVALRQHLEGKGHKKQVERQKLRTEEAVSKQPTAEDGASNMLEKVWMQVSVMTKPSQTGSSRKKQKTEAGNNVQPPDATPTSEGDFTIRERKPKAGMDVQSILVKPNATEEPPTLKTKVVNKVLCGLCNVEYNSQKVLEIHVGGKKHAAQVKKLQESTEGFDRQTTNLVSQ